MEDQFSRLFQDSREPWHKDGEMICRCMGFDPDTLTREDLFALIALERKIQQQDLEHLTRMNRLDAVFHEPAGPPRPGLAKLLEEVCSEKRSSS